MDDRYGKLYTYRNRKFFDSTEHGDDRYRVAGHGGVAWTVLGFAAVYDSETEDLEPSDQLFAVMVGDDRPFPVDADDLTKLEDEEYCSECGQIGCGHGN